MSRSNGYQILDLKDETLEVAKKMPGIYDILEGTRKPILVSNLSIGGVEKKDLFASFDISGTDYVATVYGKKLTVKYDDTVQITEV